MTVKQVQKAVASHYGLKVRDLSGRGNSPKTAQPRQLAMYLSKRLTSASLPEIGRQFGGKHHTTVLHAIKRVEQRKEDDAEFRDLADWLMESVQ